MASSRCIWISLFLLSGVIRFFGVFSRPVDTLEFHKTADESGTTLRAEVLRRWRRGVAETYRERCAERAAPWLENTQPAPEDNATLLQLRALPLTPGASHGLVFPGKSLFSFVRSVYHCCQEGRDCRSVKGIQGRLRGGTNVEFFFTREILSLSVIRAELHLQLSNPQHLDIHPVLPSLAKRGLNTRYSLWSRGNTVDLRVDLLFLFQSLQEAAGGAGGGPSLVNMRRVVFSSRGYAPGEKPTSGAQQDTAVDVWGEGAGSTRPALERSLILGCSQAGSGVSCRTGGVHPSHTPFMALYYR
ncbi:uncharacterized protein [Notothenia coriiceps]|uniref:Uncharacterized protein n=1 Tax=Notothenia coriiceps TaxID=8208 RepID=A0A6I9NC20_9TELE|nr:PREDICTED: uncharacterized protein LOC104950461 [Notothenia coriiceps]